MFVRGLTLVVAAVALLAGCSKTAEVPAEPDSVPLSIRTVEVHGPGAGSAESSKTQSAEAAVAPVRKYYDSAYFGVELPPPDFSAAFGDFTPSIAATAQGLQKGTLTPDDPSIASLRAEKLEAAVSLYADSEGATDEAIVKVVLVGSGKLVDGAALSISKADDFYLVKFGSRWVVTGYVATQWIDAPPATDTATPTTPAPATASPSKSATASPSKSPSPSPTKRR